MKKLIMITGPAGVGKTAVCRELFKNTDGAAWLDADWCWMVNPYPGKTSEQKKYAETAFGYILRGYLDDVKTRVILFSWIMHSDFIFDRVTSQLSEEAYELIKIALICSDRDVFIDRKKGNGRREEQVAEMVDMQRFAQLSNTSVIDVANMTVQQTASRILDMASLK